MSLAGFEHVFQQTAEIEIDSGFSVKAITLPLLFVLKVVAYFDDPIRRSKDLGDIHGLLKSYKFNSDDAFSDSVFDAALADFEFVPAFLLGRDVAAFSGPSDKAMIDRFLGELADTEGQLFSKLVSHEGIWGTPGKLLIGRRDAFAQGFRSAALSNPAG